MGARTRNSTAQPPRARSAKPAQRSRAAKPAQRSRAAAPAARASATPPDPTALAKALAEQWPEATCELDHQNPYQLLVATILAAQSTDKLINTVTPTLFARFPDATALAAAEPAELETLIHSTGFFRMKAKHLLGMARAVVERHGGQIPSTMAELVALPGVARKTANVVLGTAFGKAEGVVVDTHVTRLAARLGLTSETDPVKIELDLQALLPRSEWVSFPNRLIWHGRRVCFAKKPACETCALAALCPAAELPAHGTAAG
ncbi:MAG TPA: endonuclease III [Kofleriaceae bacterium]|nr:endonuclease III [Kofleriaceae bacterium]